MYQHIRLLVCMFCFVLFTQLSTLNTLVAACQWTMGPGILSTGWLIPSQANANYSGDFVIFFVRISETYDWEDA